MYLIIHSFCYLLFLFTGISYDVLYDETVRGKLCREKKIVENRIRFLKNEITEMDVENVEEIGIINTDSSMIDYNGNNVNSKLKNKENVKKNKKEKEKENGNENAINAVEIDCDSDNELEVEVEVVDDSDDEVSLFSYHTVTFD